MNSNTRSPQASVVIAVWFLCLAFASTMIGQVTTKTTTTHHEPTVETSVDRAEVVAVEGNDLIVKMEDGSLRHIPNVPESDRITVDGKEIGIHEVKPGMKLERTIKTITTPKTITTVQSVTGKVWQITPPTSVILTLQDGTNQKFNIPKGQKFTVDGQLVDAWGLKKGMKVTATKIVEEAATELEHQKQVTGQMPPPPQPPPAEQPIIIAVLHVPATPATPTELPKTASMVPVLALAGFFCIACSFALRVLRTRN